MFASFSSSGSKNRRSTRVGRAASRQSGGRHDASSWRDTADRPAKKWVQILRPPSATASFKVPTWVPLDDLSPTEREKFVKQSATTASSTTTVHVVVEGENAAGKKVGAAEEKSCSHEAPVASVAESLAATAKSGADSASKPAVDFADAPSKPSADAAASVTIPAAASLDTSTAGGGGGAAASVPDPVTDLPVSGPAATADEGFDSLPESSSAATSNTREATTKPEGSLATMSDTTPVDAAASTPALAQPPFPVGGVNTQSIVSSSAVPAHNAQEEDAQEPEAKRPRIE